MIQVFQLTPCKIYCYDKVDYCSFSTNCPPLCNSFGYRYSSRNILAQIVHFATDLVTATVIEIFQRKLSTLQQFWSQLHQQKQFSKNCAPHHTFATDLVTATVVKIFQQELSTHHTKATVLVKATVVKIFQQELYTLSYKSPTLGKSYRTKNLLPGVFEF